MSLLIAVGYKKLHHQQQLQRIESQSKKLFAWIYSYYKELFLYSKLYQYQQMANNYDWVHLETPEDYKFFACVVAEKLRNTNFKPAWREAFLKTLVEQLKPVCTFKAYERIQKLLNDVGNQKHQEEKELEQKLKKQSNVKQKNLKSLKADRVAKKYDLNEDDESFSDEEDQDF